MTNAARYTVMPKLIKTTIERSTVIKNSKRTVAEIELSTVMATLYSIQSELSTIMTKVTKTATQVERSTIVTNSTLSKKSDE